MGGCLRDPAVQRRIRRGMVGRGQASGRIGRRRHFGSHSAADSVPATIPFSAPRCGGGSEPQICWGVCNSSCSDESGHPVRDPKAHRMCTLTIASLPPTCQFSQTPNSLERRGATSAGKVAASAQFAQSYRTHSIPPGLMFESVASPKCHPVSPSVMFWSVASPKCHPVSPSVTQCHPVSPSVMFWRKSTGGSMARYDSHTVRRTDSSLSQFAKFEIQMSPGVMFWTVLARRIRFAGPQISPGVTRCHVLARFGASRRVRRPPNFTRCHPVSCFDGFWRVAPGSPAPQCHPVSPGVMFWNVLARRVGFAGPPMSPGVMF
jgi:hypothetical protein